MANLGHENVSRRYLQFIIDLIPQKDEKLQIMYGINKEKRLTEHTLGHLSGYKNSKPVRIGNAAYRQTQNDIYGILMDVIHQQLGRFSTNIENGEELWGITKGIVWIVEKHWHEKDKGIWEFRTEDRHFTFSKVLCWVAVDRAIKVAKMLKKTRKLEKWNALEQTIKKNEDDFGLPSSSFTICTFWYINALFKIGEVEEAQQLFDQVLGYSNHLGLFSEDIDFKTKRLLGNFPQAYSHLALIECAVNFSNKATAEKVRESVH